MRTDCTKLNSHPLNSFGEILEAQRKECLICEDDYCGSREFIQKKLKTTT